MAMLGVMAALSTVLTVLGTVISVNTVFFTAAAAFLAGIAVIFYGMGAATLYFCVCLMLDFLVNPNKFHALLYLALAGYILVSEGSYLRLKKIKSERKREWLHRGIRFLVFEIFYLPLLIWLPELLVSDALWEKAWFLPVMLPAGILIWIIYDLAYFAAKKWFYERFAKQM